VFLNEAFILFDTGVKEIFVHVDTNSNGVVDFEEVLFWLSIYKKGSNKEKLERMFSISWGLGGGGIF